MVPVANEGKATSTVHAPLLSLIGITGSVVIVLVVGIVYVTYVDDMIELQREHYRLDRIAYQVINERSSHGTAEWRKLVITEFNDFKEHYSEHRNRVPELRHSSSDFRTYEAALNELLDSTHRHENKTIAAAQYHISSSSLSLSLTDVVDSLIGVTLVVFVSALILVVCCSIIFNMWALSSPNFHWPRTFSWRKFVAYHCRRGVGKVLRNDNSCMLRDLIDIIGCPVLTTDASLTITSVNSSVTTLFAYKPSELIGANVSMVIPQVLEGANCARKFTAKSSDDTAESTDGSIVAMAEGREVCGLHKSGQHLPLVLSAYERTHNSEIIITAMLQKQAQMSPRICGKSLHAQHLASLRQSLGVPVIVANASMTISDTNPVKAGALLLSAPVLHQHSTLLIWIRRPLRWSSATNEMS